MSQFLNGNVIDGKAIAASIKEDIRSDVESLRSSCQNVPGLAVVIVGDRPDSATYVRMKKKACEEVGIASFERRFAADASESAVVAAVRRFNRDAAVHGILVQLPLPGHMNAERVLREICLEKDVDGFHPMNIGQLCMKGRDPLFVPCTPKGCIELLKRSGVEIRGKRAAVLGRSNIVGMPVAMLLNKEDATVTICHSRTQNMEEIVRQCDIVIAAAGQARMVQKSWLKPGAVVIDVGTNSVPDATRKSGYRLVGDVEFDGCKQVAAAITPVPGGVGPMTIAMLLSNTLTSAKRDLPARVRSGRVTIGKVARWTGILAGVAGAVLISAAVGRSMYQQHRGTLRSR